MLHLRFLTELTPTSICHLIFPLRNRIVLRTLSNIYNGNFFESFYLAESKIHASENPKCASVKSWYLTKSFFAKMKFYLFFLNDILSDGVCLLQIFNCICRLYKSLLLLYENSLYLRPMSPYMETSQLICIIN